MDSVQILAAFLEALRPARLCLLVAAGSSRSASGAWRRATSCPRAPIQWPIPLSCARRCMRSRFRLVSLDHRVGLRPPSAAGKQSAHAFFPLYPSGQVLRDTFAIRRLPRRPSGLLRLVFFSRPRFFLREGRTAGRRGVAGRRFPTPLSDRFLLRRGYGGVDAAPLLAPSLSRCAARGFARRFSGARDGPDAGVRHRRGPAVFSRCSPGALRVPRTAVGSSVLPRSGSRRDGFSLDLWMGWAHHEPGLYFRSSKAGTAARIRCQASARFSPAPTTTFAWRLEAPTSAPARLSDGPSFPLAVDLFSSLAAAGRTRPGPHAPRRCRSRPVSPEESAHSAPRSIHLLRARAGHGATLPRAPARVDRFGRLLLWASARFVNWMWVRERW